MTGSAKQSIFAVQRQRKNGLLRRFAPLRKRFAFVAGNDDKHKSALSRRDPPELCKNLVPPEYRGRRESRVSDAPAAARVV
jgi:hypothetical protein